MNKFLDTVLVRFIEVIPKFRVHRKAVIALVLALFTTTTQLAFACDGFQKMKDRVEVGWENVIWSTSYSVIDGVFDIGCSLLVPGCADAVFEYRLSTLKSKIGEQLLMQAIENPGSILEIDDWQYEAGKTFWSECQTISVSWLGIREEITFNRHIRFYVRSRPHPVEVWERNGAFVREASSSAVYVMAGGTLYHIPSMEAWTRLAEAMGRERVEIVVPDGTTAHLPTTPRDGTFIREVSDPKVYVMAGGTLYHIPSTEVWTRLAEAMGRERVEVVVPDGTTANFPMTPSDGTFIREVSDPKVYVMAGGTLYHIPSMEAWTQLAYAMGRERVEVVVPDGTTANFLTTPRDGTFIREVNHPEVYVTAGGAKYHIPSVEAWVAIAHLMGREPVEVVVTDGTTANFPTTPRDGTFIQEMSSSEIYVVTAGELCHIPSMEVWTRLAQEMGRERVAVFVPDGALADMTKRECNL